MEVEAVVVPQIMVVTQQMVVLEVLVAEMEVLDVALPALEVVVVLDLEVRFLMTPVSLVSSIVPLNKILLLVV